MDLLGYRYETETIVNISKDYRSYICKKGNKLLILEDSFCEKDLHYFTKDHKPEIKKNSIVIINNCFKNLYGTFINVSYKGLDYDIKASNLYYSRKLEIDKTL